MDGLLHSADHRLGLAEVALGVSGRMGERNVHLPCPAAAIPHVVLDYRVPAVEPVLGSQPVGRSASPCGAASSGGSGPPRGSGRSRRGTGPASVGVAATAGGTPEAPSTSASCAPCPGAARTPAPPPACSSPPPCRPGAPVRTTPPCTSSAPSIVLAITRWKAAGGPVFKRPCSALAPAGTVHYYSAVSQH